MKAAESLEGLDLNDGWHVDKLIKRPSTGTGGSFSFSYIVTDNKGKRAFLKALDFSGVLRTPDPVLAMLQFTKAYVYERDLLYQCRDVKLKRVVVPLADGTANAGGGFGDLAHVPYLIFEMGDGNIRDEVAKWKDIDLAWVLRSL